MPIILNAHSNTYDTLASHDYRLSEWRIHSDIDLPELLPWIGHDASVDIHIRCDSVPQKPVDLIFDGQLLQIGRDGSCHYRVPNVAHYWINPMGNEVIIEAQPGIDEPSIRAFLFGTVFAILCQRNNRLPLHACSIRINTVRGPAALLFSGDSGTGKSTLAAAFVQRGYAIFGDDLSVTQLDTNCAEVLPSFPRIKLWKDTLDGLGMPLTDERRVRPDLNKYCVPIRQAFCDGTVPILAIFHMQRQDGVLMSRQRIAGLKAAIHFSHAVYQNRMLAHLNGTAITFLDLANRIASAIPHHYRLQLPVGLQHLDTLIDHVLEIPELQLQGLT